MSEPRDPRRVPQGAAPRPRTGAPRRTPQGAAGRPGTRPPQGTRRPAQGRRRAPARRKKSNAAALIVILLAVVVIAVVLIFALGGKGKDQVTPSVNTPVLNGSWEGYEDTEESGGTVDAAALSDADLAAALADSDMDVEGLDESQMIEVTNLDAVEGLDETWMNVLLMGSDARSLKKSSRTDTVMICSVNKKTGQVKLASIARDTEVTLKDAGKHSGNWKINAASFFGGPELLMRTINQSLNLNIRSYALVNFTSFAAIAERLGGIDIDISEAEMEHINKNTWNMACIARKYNIDPGFLTPCFVKVEQYGEKVHLNGVQALSYARIRKIDSDFSRAERQRKVLTALLDKVRGTNAQTLVSLVTSLFGYVKTNLSVNDVITVATTVLGSDLNKVDQLMLPVNGSYTMDNRGGQSGLYDINWDTNRSELHNFIYR